MKTFISFCMLSLLLSLTSCFDGDSPVKPSSNLEILPLSVGNIWDLRGITVFNTSKPDTNFVSLNINKDTVLNGQKYYFIQSWNNWFTNKTDGLYSHSMTKDSDQLCFKYPAKKGDEIFDLYNNKIVVEEINVPIKVGLGTFNCIKYLNITQEKTKGDKDYNYRKSEWYLCPGIGIVKVVEFVEDVNPIGGISTQNSTTELVSYIIK